MGLLSLLQKLKSREKQVKILLLGLDNSGKTTILKRLCNEDTGNMMPTHGFTVRNISNEGLEMCIWDVGGETNLRPYWIHYFDKTKVLCYVIDSTDSSRLTESHHELKKLLETPTFSQTPLLIFANKQDLPNSMPICELSSTLNLHQFRTSPWCIVASSATTEEGLQEGLEWLIQVLQM